MDPQKTVENKSEYKNIFIMFIKKFLQGILEMSRRSFRALKMNIRTS
jgi:hypothetical protein